MLLLILDIYVCLYHHAMDPLDNNSKLFFLSVHILFLFLIFFRRFKEDIMLRESFLQSIQLFDYNKKIDDIMSILLPQFIREKIAEGNLAISEDQG